MKKLLFALALLIGATVQAQTYSQLSTQYGNKVNRLAPKFALLMPTASGTPVGISSLNSVNTERQAAFLFDSTANKLWVFNPKDSTWSGVGDTTGLGLIFVKYVDTAGMLANRLKISDTATMLANRLKISDTLTMLASRVRYTDTLPGGQMATLTDVNTAVSGISTFQPFTGTNANITTVASGGNISTTGTIQAGTLSSSIAQISSSLRSGLPSQLGGTGLPVPIGSSLGGGLYEHVQVSGFNYNVNTSALNVVNLSATGNATIGSGASAGGSLEVFSNSLGAYIVNNNASVAALITANTGTGPIAVFNSTAGSFTVSNGGSLSTSSGGLTLGGVGAYNNNKGSLFTTRSFVDKGYADSLKLTITGGGTFINNSTTVQNPAQMAITASSGSTTGTFQNSGAGGAVSGSASSGTGVVGLSSSGYGGSFTTTSGASSLISRNVGSGGDVFAGISSGGSQTSHIYEDGRISTTASSASNYGASLYNTSSTGQGLTVRGGSTTSHNALVVQDYNGSNSWLSVRSGDGLATFSGSGTFGGNVIAQSANEVRANRSDNTRYATMYANNTGSFIGSGSGSGDPLGLITNGTEKVTITSTGNVGIGTTSPNSKLDVNGDVRVVSTGSIVFGTGTNNLITGSSSSNSIAINTNGTTALTIASNQAITAANLATGGASQGVMATSTGLLVLTVSDQKAKQKIVPLTNSLRKLRALNMKAFEFKPEYQATYGNGIQYGGIAQQFKSVDTTLAGFNTKSKLHFIRWDMVAPLTVAAVQQVDIKVDNLEARLKRLEGIILAQQKEISSLKKRK